MEEPLSPEISTDRIIALRDANTLLPSVSGDAKEKYAKQVRKKIAEILVEGQEVTDAIIIAAIKDPPYRRGRGGKHTGRPGAAQARFRPK